VGPGWVSSDQPVSSFVCLGTLSPPEDFLTTLGRPWAESGPRDGLPQSALMTCRVCQKVMCPSRGSKGSGVLSHHVGPMTHWTLPAKCLTSALVGARGSTPTPVQSGDSESQRVSAWPHEGPLQ